jgi:hypothetical protein
MEVTMQKFIGMISLVSALVVSQGANAQGVDLATLPSIESIAAATDIRPFLAQGVPQRMVRAALHRAWVVDRRIRDFRGLQENDWAFNDISGVPGFGPLESSGNAKLLAADIFSEPERKIVSSLSRRPSLSFLYFGIR